MQKTFLYEQIIHGSVKQVFQLLCPVKEKEWLDGWDYQMVHSTSGSIEENCVFTTPHHSKSETVWHVTRYDPEYYLIEFVRVTCGEQVVRIQIKLEVRNASSTKALIAYQYTLLQDNLKAFDEIENEFDSNMKWWEQALNYSWKQVRS